MAAKATTDTRSPTRHPRTVAAARPTPSGASSPISAASPVLSVKAGGLASPWCVAMKELTQTTMMLPKKHATKIAASEAMNVRKASLAFLMGSAIGLLVNLISGFDAGGTGCTVNPLVLL